MNNLRVLDLFSAAAGGWSLGMHRAGFETMAACENVAWRRALYPIVYTLTKFGICDPRHIREIVNQVWLGPREGAQTQGAVSAVDYVVSHWPANTASLQAVLKENSLVIVPTVPTSAMVNASMATVTGFDTLVTKVEKHKRRLIAAIAAAPDFRR